MIAQSKLKLIMDKYESFALDVNQSFTEENKIDF